VSFATLRQGKVERHFCFFLCQQKEVARIETEILFKRPQEV